MLVTSPPPGRDYAHLLGAMNELLAVLWDEGDQEAALRASFEGAARGFGARKALLLLVEVVEEREPLRLRAIHVLGKLTPEQIGACERGESVAGVSPSVIHRVIAEGRAELIEDPRLHEDAARTPSLAGGSHSVLCAPIRDPFHGAALAVVYLQNHGLTEAYTQDDLAWLEGYAAAAGRVFGFYFRHERSARELEELRDEIENAPEILGDSAHTQALRRALHETFIPSLGTENPEPVLLLGERGTGKDLVARYLHAYSARRRRPFVVVNCAEITDELAASRFFGHKKGAFTGALSDEPGFFRAADGGVLFLDEIAELTPRAQAHLLRVLESHTVVPVGQTREHRIDVAVVLATNRDLDEAVREGGLREDFYDRFRTLAIRILPLRERPWDVPLLLDHFRRHQERKHRKPTLGFSEEALRALVSYAWPGNVRELARACSLFLIHAQPGARLDRALLERCLPEVLTAEPNPKAGPLLWDGVSMKEAVRAFERELILARLERHGGSAKAARESLGLTKTTFHRYVKSLGIATGGGAGEE